MDMVAIQTTGTCPRFVSLLYLMTMVLPARTVSQPSEAPYGILDMPVAVHSSPDLSSSECPHLCSGHGVCEHGVCKCAPGFTYYDCSLRVCPSDCSNNGFCYNATCHCHPGWRGADCAVRC